VVVVVAGWKEFVVVDYFWLIYGGCGGGGVERICLSVGYFWWEIMIKENKKYNI
jgi:hypothetical protein